MVAAKSCWRELLFVCVGKMSVKHQEAWKEVEDVASAVIYLDESLNYFFRGDSSR